MAAAQVPFALVEALGLHERQASLPVAALELEPSELTERAGEITGWPAGGVVESLSP